MHVSIILNIDQLKIKLLAHVGILIYLDIRRVGMNPTEKYLYSDIAKSIVKEDRWQELEKYTLYTPKVISWCKKNIA